MARFFPPRRLCDGHVTCRTRLQLLGGLLLLGGDREGFLGGLSGRGSLETSMRGLGLVPFGAWGEGGNDLEGRGLGELLPSNEG